MSAFFPGVRLTADLLNDNSLDETTNAGLVAATNFTVLGFTGRRVNGITTIEVFVSRTTGSLSEIASNTGNLADTEMCTLPTGWRPPELVGELWGNGFNDGECTISTAGVITLRSTSGTSCVPNLSNVRVTASWIAES